MSPAVTGQAAATFATDRYSKRKRGSVDYVGDESATSESDYEPESEVETPAVKVLKGKAKAKAKAEQQPADQPLPKNKIFPFMELPAELRNVIYTYTLVDPDGIRLAASIKQLRRGAERVSIACCDSLTSTHSTGKLGEQQRRVFQRPYELGPALLAVSKQINRECHDVFYSNEFMFVDTYALFVFLANCGPVAATYLKSIRLLRWGKDATLAYNHTCFAMLERATTLTTFQIDEQISWRNTAKSSARHFHCDASPWLEAVGRATGRPDGALDILKFGEEAPFALDEPNRKQMAIDFKVELATLLSTHHNRFAKGLATKRKSKGKAATMRDSSDENEDDDEEDQ